MAIRCVAGLGNPGERYEWTRHNLGFLILDRVARDRSLLWERREDAFEASGEIEGRGVVLVKPLTFMNNSGGAVRSCLLRHGLVPEELLVVVDDAALPFSRLRIRRHGGAGGHRGLASVEEALEGRVYARLRIGVGATPAGEDLADYLLRPIPPEERDRFSRLAESGADVVRDLVREGLDWAMNRHNPPAGDEVDEPSGSAGGSPTDDR